MAAELFHIAPLCHPEAPVRTFLDGDYIVLRCAECNTASVKLRLTERALLEVFQSLHLASRDFFHATGTIYQPEDEFTATEFGELNVGGQKYQCLVNQDGHCPVLISEKTGKGFSLSWLDMLKIAVHRGIDRGNTEDSEKSDAG